LSEKPEGREIEDPEEDDGLWLSKLIVEV